MGTTRAAMASEFDAMVEDISESISTAQYGYATFDDYAYGSMGYASEGDKPFILHQQITNDVDRVDAALASTPEHNGGDSAESTFEALYQAATGSGYDQNCDGAYDAATDVLPFFSSPGDLFSDGGEAWESESTGGGPTGGMGFRAEVLPILIYATDNMMRDAEAGYATPGGCPMDAGQTDVVAAASDIGARFIGIASEDTPHWGQMIELANETNSLYDTDGLEGGDEELVFHWTGTSDDFRHTVVNAVEWLLGGVTFDRVHLEVDVDPWGFIQTVSPESYDDLTIGVSGEDLTFSITLDGTVPALADDAIYVVTLNVYGDYTTLLATEPLIILVPGLF
jgi:hypothetical protein